MMRRFFPSTIRQVDEALPFVFEINTANTSTGSTTNTQFRLPLILTGTYDFDVDWGDSTSDTITVWNVGNTHTYGAIGTYTITITGQIDGWAFAGTGDRLKMIDISSWGPFNHNNGIGALYRCANMNISATDIPNFKTSTDFSSFFRNCTSLTFNSSINNWDMSNAISVNQFFNVANSFNQPIGNWDVSSVQNFTEMFRSASAFNQNIGGWNTIGATNMNGMFYLAVAFNQNIGSWNVSNVLSMNSMFRQATAFNQNIGGWDVSKVNNLVAFMTGKTAANYSAANLDAIYNGWSLLTFVNTGLNINFNTIKYTAAGQAGRDILTGAPNNWTITDGGI